MAIKTQWMGTNPRAEVTHRFPRELREVREVPEPTRMKTGVVREMFIGLGANLRDTLNKMRDWKRSQHSIAHNGRPEVAPRGQEEIAIEKLRRIIAAMKENNQELIVVATGSPFNREIHKARLLEGFKLLAIKSYEGKLDPQDHFDHINDLMGLYLVSEITKCRVFAETLTGSDKKWLRPILAGLISS